MAVRVRLNGKSFNRFKQIDGERSIDTFASEIRMIVSESPNNNSPIKIDDLVTVFLDDFKIFTGYMEKITDSEDRRSHDISFRGRSLISDLIDSTVPDNVKNTEGVVLFSNLIQLCIDGLGLTTIIKVIDNVGATFGDAKIKAASSGQKVGEFLLENARIVQVFLNDDGDGNVVINRPGGKLKTTLQNIKGATNNNIKNSSFVIDKSDRYNKYIVRSNSSLASESSTVNDLDNYGEALDSEVRSSRVLEIISDKPMTSEQCKKAAEEEANIRRARSFSYSCEVAGFTANGELWEPGKLVSVKDRRKGITGLFQTNTIKWNSGSGGEVVNIDITLPDKNTVEANSNNTTKRISSPSTTYDVKAGDTLTQIADNFNVTVDDIVIANPQIKDRDLIFDGQEIVIPGGTT